MSTPDSDLPAGRILAVVPTYNEQNQVEKVVRGICEFGVPVLVVDDGSTDDSAARAEAAGAILLRQETNQGKGAALRRGFLWALDHGYDAILTLDADCQHHPGDIPQFLQAYAGGDYDLIIGARNFEDMPWTRYTMNVLGRWTFSWVMGQPMPDNQSGYRLLSARLAEATLTSKEDGYEFEVEMIVICIQRGYQLGWVPIRTIYNEEPSHINHIQHVYNYLRLLRRVRRQLRQGEPA
ncbi:MAG: glycosyltransferase family 2 protein [Anaerolineae bacterium]|nr:glycosyltransferase family 2 protein [Anaerolineae bacterium]